MHKYKIRIEVTYSTATGTKAVNYDAGSFQDYSEAREAQERLASEYADAKNDFLLRVGDSIYAINKSQVLNARIEAYRAN